MKAAPNTLAVLVSMMALCIGCGPASRSRKPVPEPAPSPIGRRDFGADVGVVWTAVLEAIEESKGTIVAKDRDAGRIVYTLFHEPSRGYVLFNVLLKSEALPLGPPTTAVFFSVPSRRPRAYSMIAEDFFWRLNEKLSVNATSVNHR